IGVDTGTTNDMATVTVCWPRVGPKILYFFSARKDQGLDAIGQAEVLKDEVNTIKPAWTVIDPANRGVNDTIRNRFNINLENADKLGKAEHIDLMNSDMARGNIKVLPAARPALLSEWDHLVWDRSELE